MPLCRVKFLNSTPSETITRTLATFTYGDGSKSSDPANGEPGEVNIGPGGAGYRYSKDNASCVKDVWMFMVWGNGSGGDGTGDAGGGYCWTEVGLELGVNARVKQGDESAAARYALYQVDPATGARRECGTIEAANWTEALKKLQAKAKK